MQLFYAPDITLPAYTLNEEESAHCMKVLRLSAGDTLHLTDGRGTLHTVRILADVNNDHVKAGLDTVAMGVAGETPRQWFEALGSDIVHMHFIDGRPYAHLIWGDGLFPLEAYLDVLNEFGYEGLLGQEIDAVSAAPGWCWCVRLWPSARCA